MKRNQIHDNTHLTLDERKIIQVGIEKSSTKADIARTIGKDATTVAKEIRKHRVLKPRNTFNRPILCANLSGICPKPCVQKCEFFKDPVCTRRDKSPGACNGCKEASKCKFGWLYSRRTHEYCHVKRRKPHSRTAWKRLVFTVMFDYSDRPWERI